MNPLIKNEEPQWIELGGGQRRKIRAYNENAMLVEVGFDTGAVGAAHSHPHTQISYVLDGRIYLYHRRKHPYHEEGRFHRRGTAARYTAAPA